MKNRCLSLIAGSALSVSTIQAHANLLTNGSFEDGLTGWSLDGGDTFGDAVVCRGESAFFGGASEGECGLQLNGGNTTPDAVLEQIFETVEGAEYHLSFNIGAFNQRRTNIDASVLVEIFGDGLLLTDTPLIANDTTPNMPVQTPLTASDFETFSVFFTAVDDITLLRISDQTGFGGFEVDTILDDFVVTLISAPAEVPLPAAAWLFMAGIAGLRFAPFGKNYNRICNTQCS